MLLLTCFFLSGFSGLIYQTAWLRQFALVFGTSELALVTVLAAYMGGLALGAAVAGRWVVRLRRVLLVYAFLELGIGAAAVMIPAAIHLSSSLHVALLGSAELPPAAGSTGSALFYLVSSFSILLVPTGLMGATLPLLARWAVRTDAEIGSRIGYLYAINTIGAAAGTLTAAFVLLPHLALGNTVLTAAAVNLLVFALAFMVARTAPPDRSEPCSTAGIPQAARQRLWILPLMLLSGVVSFTWEIMWTRLLCHLVGSSVYAFATMLATLLVGLAIGSTAAARLASSVHRARCGFVIAQVAVGLFSLAAFTALDELAELLQASTGQHGVLLNPFVLSAVTLLPAAIAIGATFPFAVRWLATDADDAASSSARVFSWNTVGGILGALLTGYVVLPKLGFDGTAALAVMTSLLLGLVASVANRPRNNALASVTLIAMVVVVLFRPTTPWELLRHGELPGGHQQRGDVAYYGVGKSATVMLFEKPSGWVLTTNGLQESTIARAGRSGTMVLARWLSLLAVAARPELQSLLVVGLGAGVSVEEVPASVSEIHVVELEPEVVQANRQISALRRRDPLADPRLHLHVNDARGALRLVNRRFGAIVSQPSHPWTSGASHLFTREFVELVKDRLEPDGVFVQWMGLSFVDTELLRAMVATVASVFPYAELYMPGRGGVLLIASQAPLAMQTNAARAIANDPGVWQSFAVFSSADILATRMLDARGARAFAGSTRPITDAHNLFQTRAPRILDQPLGARGAELLLAPFEPLAPPFDGIESLYLVRRLIRLGMIDRAERLAGSLPDPVQQHTALGLFKLARGKRKAGEFALREALQLNPEAVEALAGLLQVYRPNLLRGESVSFISRITDDPAAVVVEGWQHSSSGQWQEIRSLEPRLAAVAPHYPLFAAATRLRATWRIKSNDPALADEAIELLALLLGPIPTGPDLLLRAQAAIVAQRPLVALAALEEAAPRRPGSGLARQWRTILRSVPVDDRTAAWRRELQGRLARPRAHDEDGVDTLR